MSAVELAEAEVVEKPKARHVTFQLVDMKPSSFIMDGPGVDDFDGLDTNPVISSPSYRFIRRTSRYKIDVPAENGRPKTFRYGTLRYINGCSILDKDEQDRLGIKTNYLADIIIFRNGHLSATDEGDTSLFEYLHRCEYNVDAPERPDNAEDIFKALDAVGEAVEVESIFDLQAKCLAALSALKKENGKNGYFYNEDALEFYCALFKIPAFEGGYGSEAWVALAQKAQEDPQRFLNSLSNARTLFEADVVSAISFSVITIDQAKAFFTDGNQLIVSLDSDLNEEQKVSELIDFMANPKNKNQYENLRVRLRKAKDQATSVIK